MALISIDNFIEPLRKPVHLVTILLLAGVFGIFRASGGGFELQNSDDSNLVGSSQNQEYRAFDQRLNSANQGSQNSILENDYKGNDQSQHSEKKESDLDALLKRPNSPSTNNAKSDTGRSSALDEIEKKLGLR